MSASELVYNLIFRPIAAYAWLQFGMSLKHQINLILIMCFIIYIVTVNVNFNRILASRPRCCRLCPEVGMERTLIITHTVTYALPQFEISLTHEISLIVLILFYHTQCNENARVTNTPILSSRPRSHRICPGASLWMTLIFRRIAAYAWPRFGMSLNHQINLILIMCFIIYNVTVNVNYTNI